MKKIYTIILSIIIMIGFSGCSNKEEMDKTINKEGVSPYKLSESDKYLLQSLDLEKDVNLISFKAPKMAKSLKVKSYILDNNGEWDNISNIHVLSGDNANSEFKLEGTFAMLIKEGYSIDMHITTMGRASQKGNPLDIESEFMSSSRGYLTDFEEIELNKEIPVAIVMYDSGTSMSTYSMDDFFSPYIFADIDIVQAVTLIFTDES